MDLTAITFAGGREISDTSRTGRPHVANGAFLVIIIWHLLNDEKTYFTDTGSGCYNSHLNYRLGRQ